MMKDERSPIAPAARQCAFCSGTSMTEVIDFGEVALAGGFLKPEQFDDEAFFRLRVYFCNDCYAVQLLDTVDAETLFRNYFYFSSAIGTLRQHFVDFATEAASRFLHAEKATVLEIGCNDGILLRPLADQAVGTLIGVDPATNVVKSIDDPRIHVVNDFFSEALAETIVGEYGTADMIVANNVYAHVPDIQGVTRGIHRLMDADGVFIFEVHMLGNIIHDFQYDMIYHEHIYYYSLLALENHFARHGMVVFDVKPIPIHGGSMRYYACKQQSRHARNISPRVTLLRNHEIERGLNRAETFERFAESVAERKRKLADLLEQLHIKGKRVAGYGASGRANTIIQYCGITDRHLDYIVDDAPAKWGFHTPGSHFLIRSNEILDEQPPDYLLIFAWSYLAEITRKCSTYLDGDGRLIVPLPDVQIILRPTSTDVL